MTLLDWTIVVCLNLSVIALGLFLARGTSTSSQWFLGGRSLPWWAVGMSMFATNVDNADLVAVTASTYREGLHILSVYALGSAFGGILAAFCVVPAIYRAGFYTNAEYLEARFGKTARVLSALIQLQYRSSMLGLMTYSVYLLLTRLVDLEPNVAWGVIVLMVICSGIYTAAGGLKSVVWTDALQGVIMLVAGAVIFVAVWNTIGGWSGMMAGLEAGGTVDGIDLGNLARVSGYRGTSGRISPLFIAMSWTIVGCGYWTVNHTQTMRLMGTRSLWDMKMAAVVGVGVSLPIMIASACLGVFARAIPELQSVDDPNLLYPMLTDRYLAVGFKGIVVAGIFAAAVSTFDSMGSALSAIFTRDIYARLFVPDADDEHYVRVGRIAAVAVLASGFLYLPFILKQEHMLKAFTTLIPVFVTPLLTMYVLGITSRVHRRSGGIGLLLGGLYGVIALIARETDRLPWIPDWISNRWMAGCWSVAITATAMLTASLFLGFEPRGASQEFQESGWLQRSREALPPLREHPFESSIPWYCNSTGWALLLVAISTWLIFGVFW